MAEGSGLLNRRTMFIGTGGSNPPLSAIFSNRILHVAGFVSFLSFLEWHSDQIPIATYIPLPQDET